MATAGQEEDQDQDAVGGQKTINHTFLSLSQITALSEEDAEGIQKKLAEFLNLKQLKTSLMEAILLDYYTAGFCWAKEMNFSVMQLSQFMDLINFLLENLRDRHMSLEDNVKELGRAMSGIGETDSERSGDLDAFNTDQAKAIIDHMNMSLFRLYKLYQHIFHRPREEHVISYEYMVELAPPAVTSFPAPPEEGVSSDFYASLLALPTDMEPKGSEPEGHLGEPSPEAESFGAGAVSGFACEDQEPTVLPNPK
ncbi:ciliary-associated calcium-binding coiled-coil protein 1 [Excalfactoria chinensis]|uniref:ciliary-associated calcium-binding coiled-coil protein 1 n=1 Tax=Excalfactoria chinensis TaxID=46218 RepID=UPI003B3AEE66